MEPVMRLTFDLMKHLEHLLLINVLKEKMLYKWYTHTHNFVRYADLFTPLYKTKIREQFIITVG